MSRRGEVVRLVKRRVSRDRAKLESAFRETVAVHFAECKSLDGFAIVLWDRNGASTECCLSKEKAVPVLLIPEFVKMAVLRYSITNEMNIKLGLSKDEDEPPAS